MKGICDICKDVLNGNIMVYFMVGTLSIKGNLILFAIVLFDEPGFAWMETGCYLSTVFFLFVFCFSFSGNLKL